jgi:hypothetical protein
MTAVSFSRLSSAPPPLREIAEVEADGSWRAWRSVGTAVGRFAGGDGGSRVLEAVRAALDAQLPAPAEGGTLDEATDEIVIDGSALEVPHGHVPAGPWGEALEACRDLVARAPEHPLAAIAVTMAGPGLVRLEHRGSEALEVELGSGRVEITTHDERQIPVQSTFTALDLGAVEARPGWSAEVRIDPVEAPTGGMVGVEVSFVAVDDGVHIPVTISSERAARAAT